MIKTIQEQLFLEWMKGMMKRWVEQQFVLWIII